MDKKIILASNSPRRQELLRGLDVEFTVDTGNTFEESMDENVAPHDIPVLMAKGKSHGFHRPLAPDEILITADTVVIVSTGSSESVAASAHSGFPASSPESVAASAPHQEAPKASAAPTPPTDSVSGPLPLTSRGWLRLSEPPGESASEATDPSYEGFSGRSEAGSLRGTPLNDSGFPSTLERSEAGSLRGATLNDSGFPSTFEVLGKPHSHEEAVQMLRDLSGRIHEVVTAVTIRDCEHEVNFSDSTLVRFCELPEEDIEYYVDKYRPYDKAGAYGIQEWIGYSNISGIEGSFYNVMGFPVHRVYAELKKFLAR